MELTIKSEFILESEAIVMAKTKVDCTDANILMTVRIIGNRNFGIVTAFNRLEESILIHLTPFLAS
jgi:hypothetical protein